MSYILFKNRNLRKGPTSEGLTYTPPLDEVTGASVAYGLRLLKSDYAGSAIRIRRSSDDAESDIGFTTSGALDVAAASSFIGAGSGFIVEFYDQTGNGNDLSQSTDARQPAYNASGLNSLPTVDGDGSDYQMFMDSNVFNSFTDMSAYTVLSKPNNTNEHHLIGSASASAGFSTTYGTGLYTEDDKVGIKQLSASNGLKALLTTTDLTGGSYLSFKGEDPASTDQWARYNGTTEGTDTGTMYEQGYSQSCLFASSGSAQTANIENFDGKLGEMIVYFTQDHQSATIETLEANQKDYWGL